MNTMRPDNADPIPVRLTTRRMRTLLLRFVALLMLAVVIMALAWR